MKYDLTAIRQKMNQQLQQQEPQQLTQTQEKHRTDSKYPHDYTDDDIRIAKMLEEFAAEAAKEKAEDELLYSLYLKTGGKS